MAASSKLVDIAKLTAIRMPLDEMIVGECIQLNVSRARAGVHLFKQLGFDLYSERCADGWWIAAAIEKSAVTPIEISPNLLEKLEENWQCSQEEEFAPDPVEEALRDLVSDNAIELASASVQAAQEEIAIMALLAVLINDAADVFMSDDRVAATYPIDPCADQEAFLDFWNSTLLEHAQIEIGEELQGYVDGLVTEADYRSQEESYYRYSA
jgi:hypothetical protein